MIIHEIFLSVIVYNSNMHKSLTCKKPSPVNVYVGNIKALFNILCIRYFVCYLHDCYCIYELCKCYIQKKCILCQK